MPVTKGKLDKCDQSRLDQNYSFLLGNLDATYMMDLLIDRGIFDITDSEIIRSKPTTNDRNRTLLDILYNSGPAAYGVFRDILKKDSAFIVQKLDDTELVTKDNRSQGQILKDELTDHQKAHRLTELDLLFFSKSFSTAIMSVAAGLNISQMEVQQIQLSNQYGGTLNHNQSMLIKWRNKTGRAATLLAILEAFVKAEEVGGEIDWSIVETGVKRIQ
ncbi:uncharacterized protein LOC117330812 [Pecten maximus]|uniref:uncharacterized protein LOC117330812 n=1 Tax=Pecten maximus TaxID=6579 RepID=UPI001458D329|nr:uncharacterized protein LOC117330812 [Pecten maximus]XP_033745204.1 uncharacterized protein LOC117330812 [Pecten maximus]